MVFSNTIIATVGGRGGGECILQRCRGYIPWNLGAQLLACCQIIEKKEEGKDLEVDVMQRRVGGGWGERNFRSFISPLASCRNGNLISSD